MTTCVRKNSHAANAVSAWLTLSRHAMFASVRSSHSHKGYLRGRGRGVRVRECVDERVEGREEEMEAEVEVEREEEERVRVSATWTKKPRQKKTYV